MIHGEVSAACDAMIAVRVSGVDPGVSVEAAAVIDTGFSGSLTLSPTLIEELGLPYLETQIFTLGDGREISLDAHLATVLWDDIERDVFVLAAAGGALIGMDLLYGYRLTVDVIDGGQVTVALLNG